MGGPSSVRSSVVSFLVKKERPPLKVNLVLSAVTVYRDILYGKGYQSVLYISKSSIALQLSLFRYRFLFLYSYVHDKLMADVKMFSHFKNTGQTQIQNLTRIYMR